MWRTTVYKPGNSRSQAAAYSLMNARAAQLSDLMSHTYVGVVPWMGREICSIVLTSGQMLCWRASLVAPALQLAAREHRNVLEPRDEGLPRRTNSSAGLTLLDCVLVRDCTLL
jgi:hypothetical protein